MSDLQQPRHISTLPNSDYLGVAASRPLSDLRHTGGGADAVAEAARDPHWPGVSRRTMRVQWLGLHGALSADAGKIGNGS